MQSTRKSALTVLAFLVLGVCLRSSAAADWSRFRGPNGTGISPDAAPTPVTWNDTENIKWKIEMPGRGSSSPIVVGDKVFVTCWSGYGVDPAEIGKQDDLMRHLLCLDRNSGAILWTKDVKAVLPEDRFEGMFTEHGYASHTPVSDGEKVFAFFGKSGVYAYDLNGNELWNRNVGSGLAPTNWGSASSPILYKNLVIVTAAAEDEAVVALNKENGEEVWKQKAGGLSGSWSTPILVEVDANRSDLVIGVPYEIWGLNPETGKLRWYCEAMESNTFCSSLIAHKGIVFALEGRGGGALAVRAGGKDDVTKTHVVWNGRAGNNITTPIVYNDRIYFISNKVVSCLDAASGEQLFQQRLEGASTRIGNAQTGPGRDVSRTSDSGQGRGPGRRGFGGFGGGMFGAQDYSSPVVADGKLYWVSRNGDVYVLGLGEMFEQLAVNRMTTDLEDFSATPAISNGDIFIRSNKHLYCVGFTSKP